MIDEPMGDTAPFTREAEPSARDMRTLNRLGIVAAVLPGLLVVLFEDVRHAYLDSMMPVGIGNVVAGLIPWAIGFVLIGLIFRSVKRLHRVAVARSAETAGLRVAADEREQLSRELHDSSAQLFSFLLIKIDTIAQLVEEGRSAAASREIEVLRTNAEAHCADLRDVIAGLRLRAAEIELAAGVRELCARFEEVHGIRATVSVADGLVEPDPQARAEMLAIVQEALVNVRRHAAATALGVRLECDETGGLAIDVTDDGGGVADPLEARRSGRGYGLAMMEERARRIGGSIEVSSPGGAGTTVRLHVPVTS